MKKYLLTALLSYAVMIAAAQNKPDNTKYLLPNGAIVTADKLDSVNKSWGNKGYLMNHDDKNPNEVHISPMTDAFLKEMAEREASLKQMLNQPAPDFKLTGLSGKTWTLADLKGKTIVLNFWFTSCVPCLEEMPKLNEVEKKYASNNIVFFAFALEDNGTLKNFLKTHTFNYTIFSQTKETGKAYHVSNYPTSMVIDPSGIIRFLHLGGNNIVAELSSAIESAQKI
ncbi:peroxiredoxin family protein [Mucilaginibacter sp. X4EP1]|uniref:peroxiredoxin family protein n=1 Tax=Mucilaginibacter sp. X4EP1 TaxID=2723092 RepID=UPI0021674A5C|nr:TlpA disulfide reductase family protein [Mucilaginibacter sp. X4EP1]MCS3814020.1 peroxiredoxin [Mucilaginibacter sp. X4EP1]